MSPEREKSKRQARREEIQRRQQRQRLITIGLIIVGALLIVAPIAYQMLRPMAEVVAVATRMPRDWRECRWARTTASSVSS